MKSAEMQLPPCKTNHALPPNMVAIGTCTNWFTSAVSLTVGLGWRIASQILIRQTGVRFVVSVAATLMKEGFKVKFGAFAKEQQQRNRSRIITGVKHSVKKTIKWAKHKRGIEPQTSGVTHDVVALDAGKKYKMLAERRLKAARKASEAATLELKEAERGMDDADVYVKSIRRHCSNIEKQTSTDGDNDFVFVDSVEEEQDRRSTEQPSASNSVADNALISVD